MSAPKIPHCRRGTKGRRCARLRRTGIYQPTMRTWLAPSGVAAAAVVGGAVTAGAGWRGLALLAFFFVTASALTRGGGRRRAAQVVANGGVAAAAALLALRDPAWLAAFAGSLAAATADTWSTEIGSRSRAMPRLLTTGRPVPRGSSGGVTWLGTAGGVAGAIALAASGFGLGVIPLGQVLAVSMGGVAGGLADSVLGATVQARFRCDACGREGESPGCACGTRSRRVAGLPGFSNDAVNFLCTFVGAVVAAAPVALRTAGLA
jgi:uncharacterized protein (TIGR00297 family)